LRLQLEQKPNMKFTVDNKEKYSLIKSGVEKLDSLQAPDLKSELVFLNKKGIKNIILDLSDTRYCDSSGLSAVLVGNRLCKSSNGSFVISGLQEPVKKLVSISQLDSVLNITSDVSKAIELINAEEVERDLGDQS
jgi:anti-sigma B factor antagonist